MRSQRWVDLQKDPRVSVLIGAGGSFTELRGVELLGSVSAVGEVPRNGAPVEELVTPELLFARKYTGADQLHYDGRHAWLRIRPRTVRSLDFRKAVRAQVSPLATCEPH